MFWFLSLQTYLLSETLFTLVGRWVWLLAPPADGAQEPRARTQHPPPPHSYPRLPLCLTPAPPGPPSPQSSQVPGREAHRTLPVSRFLEGHADDACAWGGLERSVFLSPVNCITGQPLGAVPQSPVVSSPFPVPLPLCPCQAPSGQGRMSRGGGGQGAGPGPALSMVPPFAHPVPPPRAGTECFWGQET